MRSLIYVGNLVDTLIALTVSFGSAALDHQQRNSNPSIAVVANGNI